MNHSILLATFIVLGGLIYVARSAGNESSSYSLSLKVASNHRLMWILRAIVLAGSVLVAMWCVGYMRGSIGGSGVADGMLLFIVTMLIVAALVADTPGARRIVHRTAAFSGVVPGPVFVGLYRLFFRVADASDIRSLVVTIEILKEICDDSCGDIRLFWSAGE